LLFWFFCLSTKLSFCGISIVKKEMSSYGDGGFMTDAPAAAAEGGKETGFSGSQQVHLLPVTCKQVNGAILDGERFLIDNQELSHITLVGQMSHCLVQANYILVTLDDGTGLVNVKYWVDPTSPATAQVKELCSANNYLRIYGNIRSFNGQRDVLAQRIQAVNDFSEVTFHMLQCIATHLANTRGPLTASVEPKYNPQTNVSDTGMSYPSNVHHMVHEIVHADSSANGQDIRDIYSKLAGVTTEAKINEAVSWFIDAGVFFYGIDKNHYKCS